jgi:dTDP-4-dehydrorhamnose reductase
MSLESPIVVTGAGGMLAHAFNWALQLEGIEPVMLDRAGLDITDEASVRRAIEAHRPRVVINCAAYTNVDKCEIEPDAANAVNGTGVGHLARACAKHGAKLVHFSTDYVFAPGPSVPRKPGDPIGPASAYGRSKLLGEQALTEAAPASWLLTRIAWLYGPNGRHFVKTMVNAARAGKPLRVVDDQVGSPTFTYDVALATVKLLQANASGVVHVANTGEVSWCDFARAILERFGIEHPVEPITSATWKQNYPQSANRPAYSVLDSASFTRATGLQMRSWQDALDAFHQIAGNEP